MHTTCTVIYIHGGMFKVINQTIEPGTLVEMCVSYDNNKNLTRCEDTATADHPLGSYLMLQVDIDAEDVESNMTAKPTVRAR